MNFTFNSESSSDYGVLNVTFDSGMQEEPFLPTRKILEQKIRGNNKPYFLGVEYEPLTIPVRIVFEKDFNIDKLRNLANWLTTDNYAPLIFESKPSHIYYTLLVDEGTLTHNSINQGYVDVTFRCDSPWAWTPAYSQFHDFSSNVTDGTNYTINNVGDLTIQPILEVEIVSGTEFSIQNLSNKGERLSLVGLAVGEKLIIDCQNQTIDSDIPLTYRYGNRTLDSQFISFIKGNNYLNIKGNVKITFKYRGQLRG